MIGDKVRYLIATMGGVVLVGTCASGVLAVQSNGASATASVRAVGVRPGPVTDRAKLYRNGVYSAVGRYATPGGDESIGVVVQIGDQKVIAVTVQVEAESPTARQFQEQFRSRVLPSIVSKDIATARVSRVAGASLTSLGFNDALERIRAESDV